MHYAQWQNRTNGYHPLGRVDRTSGRLHERMRHRVLTVRHPARVRLPGTKRGAIHVVNC
jgi:hypothetical protein